MRDVLFFTCEHASNRIPPPFARWFRGAKHLLSTHRGWDIGARDVAESLARTLRAPLYCGESSRLLVDLNRSLGHPKLFSRYSAGLSEETRAAIVARWWRPHRTRVERHIERLVNRGARVLHVAVHSFTPVLAGEVRNADIGLLYDPSRAVERTLCAEWQRGIAASGLRVRRNYPYAGKSDGFCTYLRGRFEPAAYAGIELELNQKLLLSRGASVARMLASVLRARAVVAASW
jgi:predicted N-formylglutamate amidohydrolase